MPYRREEDVELTVLVLRAQNGEEAAVDKLCIQMKREAYSICLSFLKNHDDAEDACGQVLAILYHRISGFRVECKFSTWFYTISARVCIDKLRKRRRECQNDHKLRELLYTAESDASQAMDPLISHIRHYRRILEILHDHPGYCVAQLKYQEGKSWEEIALITKRPKETCRSQLRSFKLAANNKLTANKDDSD